MQFKRATFNFIFQIVIHLSVCRDILNLLGIPKRVKEGSTPQRKTQNHIWEDSSETRYKGTMEPNVPPLRKQLVFDSAVKRVGTMSNVELHWWVG